MFPHKAPRSRFTGVPGWESLNEQKMLLSYASQVPPNGLIAEIGAEFGMSASLFCEGADASVQIYSVDLFPGDLLKQHRNNLIRGGYTEGSNHYTRSKQIKGDSKEVWKKWDLGAIDLLFVDGDHSYKGVKADIEGWIPLVKVGGVVLFHDAAPATNLQPHPLHFEVELAINEWLAEDDESWVEENSVDTIRAFRRVK